MNSFKCLVLAAAVAGVYFTVAAPKVGGAT